jgi:hypothetical protein
MTTTTAVIGANTASVAYMSMVSNAIKACGSLVQVDPLKFHNLVESQEAPIVIFAKPGVFSSKIKYLTSYKGLAFHCKTHIALSFSDKVEMVHARKVSIPDI